MQVIVTDMDDRGDDDLIGLACTSVGTGYRWLDLIRHGVAYVVGSVEVHVVFVLADASAPAAAPLATRAVNGSRGAPAVGCDAGSRCRRLHVHRRLGVRLRAAGAAGGRRPPWRTPARRRRKGRQRGRLGRGRRRHRRRRRALRRPPRRRA